MDTAKSGEVSMGSKVAVRRDDFFRHLLQEQTGLKHSLACPIIPPGPVRRHRRPDGTEAERLLFEMTKTK